MQEQTHVKGFNALPDNPTVAYADGDARVVKFVHILGERRADYGLDGSTPNRLSILHIMQLAITRCKEKGQEPTPEQVTFVIHLLMWCVANLDTDIEPIQENLGTSLQVFSDAHKDAEPVQFDRSKKSSSNDSENGTKQHDWRDMIQEIVINQLLAEFLDETKQTALEVHLVLTYSEEDEVLDNPNHRNRTW